MCFPCRIWYLIRGLNISNLGCLTSLFFLQWLLHIIIYIYILYMIMDVPWVLSAVIVQGWPSNIRAFYNPCISVDVPNIGHVWLHLEVLSMAIPGITPHFVNRTPNFLTQLNRWLDLLSHICAFFFWQTEVSGKSTMWVPPNINWCMKLSNCRFISTR